MMPNIVKGSSTRSLLGYLVGPGKRNEHERPHLVAGDPVVVAWYGTSELSFEDAGEIARALDAPLAQLETVRANASLTWHCSLSLAPDEPALDDETWGRVAGDFMRLMGFDSDESPARWVAVHHGKTSAGGDHIHIAATRVREDGTIVPVAHDFTRAQQAAGELERKYGLRVLTSRDSGRSQRAEVGAETEIARRAGYAENPRETLARTVRACAGAADRNEAEFVRQLRREGLLVQPFYRAGKRAEVTGYSVALRLTDEQRAAGERVRYIGGGKLGRDLTLQALRNAWGHDEQATPPEAAEEWWAAKRHQRIAVERTEIVVVTQSRVTATAVELERVVAELRAVPPSDTAQWALVSSRASWTMSALAHTATGDERSQLRATARALGAGGQTRAWVRRDPGATLATDAITSAAMLVMGSRRDPQLQWVALMNQLAHLTAAIFRAQYAAREVHLARSLRDAEAVRLAAVLQTSKGTTEQEVLWSALGPPRINRGVPGGHPTSPATPAESERRGDGPAISR